jgi:TetR/AcrR family transcriptional regulator of autoinduction and epiphytic fitness
LGAPLVSPDEMDAMIDQSVDMMMNQYGA